MRCREGPWDHKKSHNSYDLSYNRLYHSPETRTGPLTFRVFMYIVHDIGEKMKALIPLIIVAMMSGCTTTTQKLNPAVYYKQDMCVTYETGEVKTEKIKNFFKRFKKGKYRKTQQVKETVSFCGVGVLPNMAEYNIKINSFGALNFFALTTCHEETTTENPDGGFFKKKGELYFNYTPTMERGKACPLYISAYNKKQRHGWGFLAFEHPRYKLSSVVYCNGYVNQYNGVSVCQSREGLIQKIHFPEPVKLVKPVTGAADRKGECPVLGKKGDTEITFQIPARECIYGFIGQESKKIHMLYTIGYEDIIVRE